MIVVAPSVTSLGTGVISSITPPVAAAYGARHIFSLQTAFIVPYLFVYYPELLLLNFWTVAYRLAVSCAGIAFLSMATMGFGRAPMNVP